MIKKTPGCFVPSNEGSILGWALVLAASGSSACFTKDRGGSRGGKHPGVDVSHPEPRPHLAVPTEDPRPQNQDSRPCTKDPCLPKKKSLSIFGSRKWISWHHPQPRGERKVGMVVYPFQPLPLGTLAESVPALHQILGPPLVCQTESLKLKREKDNVLSGWWHMSKDSEEWNVNL